MTGQLWIGRCRKQRMWLHVEEPHEILPVERLENHRGPGVEGGGPVN